jgi:predicted dehydrogenase
MTFLEISPSHFPALGIIVNKQQKWLVIGSAYYQLCGLKTGNTRIILTPPKKGTEMKPVSIVIVGLNFGRHIVDELTRDGGIPDLRIVGLCDLDLDKAKKMAAEHGGLNVYDSLNAVLADPNVDAVGLYTGPDGRAKLLSTIINAGKDVMTTKPFELDVDAAIAVLEEARILGRVIHLNSPRPGISPDAAVIQDWREKYDLGAPVAARAEVWAHYREEADGGWYDDPEKCPVAPVFRLGIYLINDLVRIFGRARRVGVMGTRLFTGRPTPDNGQLSIEFENGALANVFASFCVRDGDHYRNGLTLNFERGTIYRNVGPQRGTADAEMAIVTNKEMWAPRELKETKEVDNISGKYDWAGFAAAVRKEADAPTYEIEHIVEPIRIINAMTRAEQSGRIEKV